MARDDVAPFGLYLLNHRQSAFALLEAMPRRCACLSFLLPPGEVLPLETGCAGNCYAALLPQSLLNARRYHGLHCRAVASLGRWALFLASPSDSMSLNLLSHCT
jgi:hypothetical protein